MPEYFIGMVPGLKVTVLVTFTALLAILVAAVKFPVNNHRQLSRVIRSHDS